MVRKGGLEPPRLAAPDPKSGASANSATLALLEGVAEIQACLFLIVNASGSYVVRLRPCRLWYAEAGKNQRREVWKRKDPVEGWRRVLGFHQSLRERGSSARDARVQLHSGNKHNEQGRSCTADTDPWLELVHFHGKFLLFLGEVCICIVQEKLVVFMHS